MKRSILNNEENSHDEPMDTNQVKIKLPKKQSVSILEDHMENLENDFDKIILNENHIQSIEFNHSKLLNQTSIKYLVKWDNIPKFSIITGRNGTGKTQLLNYIKDYHENHKLQTNIAFVDEISILQSNQYNSYGSHLSKTNTNSNSNIRVFESLKNISFEYLIKTTETSDVQNMVERIEQNIRAVTGNTYMNKEEQQKIIQKYLEELNSLKISLNDSTESTEYKYDKIEDLIKKLPTSPSDNNKLLKILELLYKRDNEKRNYIDQFKRLSPTEDLKFLFDFYCNGFNSTEPKNHENFYILLTNQTNYESFLKNYAEKKLVEIKDEIIQDLKEFGFQIGSKMDSSSGKTVYYFEKIDESNPNKFVQINKFSTGEIFFLNLLALKYETNELNMIKPNIILFDEPDKSYDPDIIRNFFDVVYNNFCIKNNIQIIMTTHRTDTIKLAANVMCNDIGIFSMKKNRNNRIQQNMCKPLIAAFRLSFDRELFKVNIKIYVEAPDDSKFYAYYYKCFYTWCQELRDIRPKTAPKKKIMSRRYQLDFISTSLEKSSGGGFEAVITSLQRAINSFRYCVSDKPQLINPLLKKPFALIDLDTDNEKKLNIKISNKKNCIDPILIKKVVILSRYAIENYIFDPILFFFNKTNQQQVISQFPDSEFKQKCLSFFEKSLDDLEPLISRNDSNIFDWYFEAIFKKILESPDEKKNLFNFLNKSPDQEIKRTEDLDKMFDKLLKEQFDDYLEGTSNRDDFLLRTIKETRFLKKTSYLFKFKPTIARSIDENYPTYFLKYKRHITTNNRTIDFNYPTFFLKYKGHSIESAIVKLFKIKNEQKNDLIDSMFYDIPNFYMMPLDLNEKFLELNNMVREQSNDILKK